LEGDQLGMDMDRISVVREPGGGWAVKHGEGYLGATKAQEDAILIGRDLVDWLSKQGRQAELHVERSFSPRR